MESIEICGVRIDGVTRKEALQCALEAPNSPVVVMTPNAVMLEGASRDAALQRLLNAATLSLPDGAGVLMAAKRMGRPLPERVSGIDFAEDLLAEAKGMRVYLVGGREDVADAARQRLSGRYPKAFFVGAHHGYFADGSTEEQEILQDIQAVRPDVLFVCLGFPRQEQWILQHASVLPSVRIFAALGGSLDVWSGRVLRAPRMLSQWGLEWAWRMVRDPQKLARLPALLRFALRRKF